MSNYSTTCACKKCGKTAILKVTLVSPNSMGGASQEFNCTRDLQELQKHDRKSH